MLNESRYETRHESEHGWVSMAQTAPAASLRDLVRGDYCGWTEFSRQPMRRREVASTVIPLIINFGPAYRLVSGADSTPHGIERQSFVAGLYDTWVAVDSATTSCALQVNFTPLGAHRLLRCAMSELATRSVDVGDALGAPGVALTEQLGNCDTWSERFVVLDTFLQARLRVAERSPAVVEWAWQELVAHHGDLRITSLCAESGWSAKRLIAAFREHVGLPPKTVARILRFEHLVARIDARASTAWSTRALDSGFFDQSHLIRDFAEFAGCTPSVYLRERSLLAAVDTPAA